MGSWVKSGAGAGHTAAGLLARSLLHPPAGRVTAAGAEAAAIAGRAVAGGPLPLLASAAATPPAGGAASRAVAVDDTPMEDGTGAGQAQAGPAALHALDMMRGQGQVRGACLGTQGQGQVRGGRVLVEAEGTLTLPACYCPATALPPPPLPACYCPASPSPASPCPACLLLPCLTPPCLLATACYCPASPHPACLLLPTTAPASRRCVPDPSGDPRHGGD